MCSPETGEAKRTVVDDHGFVEVSDVADGIFLAIGLVGAIAIAAAVFLTRRRRPAPAERGDGWRTRMAAVYAAGREVIDLATGHDPERPGGGLTVDQLSTIEGKLDLLVARIGDARVVAPGPDDARLLRLAALRASALNEAVRTERRLRLKSATPTSEKFDTLALQIATERSALDDLLMEISGGTGASP